MWYITGTYTAKCCYYYVLDFYYHHITLSHTPVPHPIGHIGMLLGNGVQFWWESMALYVMCPSGYHTAHTCVKGRHFSPPGEVISLF